MPTKLTDKMTWGQICSHVLTKIRIKQDELPTFRKWFMKREKVGYLIDPLLIKRCFFIWKELNNNLDHFIVLCGREGFGKSTLSFAIAGWINTNFTLKNVCYGSKQYLDLLSEKTKGHIKSKFQDKILPESIVLDEGVELLSREAMSVTNRTLAKTFMVQRVLRFVILINIPSFFMLDNVIRTHRVRTLIDVIGRGRYKCCTGKAIPIIAKEGMLTKNISRVKLPSGYFWHGYFTKEFPKAIDRQEYEEHKIEAINKMLEDMKDDVVSKKMIAAGKVAKEIGASPDTIIRMIKKQEVEGKMIGGKWFLTRRSYEKLITP